MIHCRCTDCDAKKTFTNLQEARNAKWFVWGTHINENEFYASCPICDATPNVTTKPKGEGKLINSKIIAYD